MSGTPVIGTPVIGTPVIGTPVYGTPVYQPSGISSSMPSSTQTNKNANAFKMITIGVLIVLIFYLMTKTSKSSELDEYYCMEGLDGVVAAVATTAAAAGSATNDTDSAQITGLVSTATEKSNTAEANSKDAEAAEENAAKLALITPTPTNEANADAATKKTRIMVNEAVNLAINNMSVGVTYDNSNAIYPKSILKSIAYALATLTRNLNPIKQKYNTAANYYNYLSKSNEISLVNNSKISFTQSQILTELQKASNNISICQCAINDTEKLLNSIIYMSKSDKIKSSYAYSDTNKIKEITNTIINLTTSDIKNNTIVGKITSALSTLKSGSTYFPFIFPSIDIVLKIKTPKQNTMNTTPSSNALSYLTCPTSYIAYIPPTEIAK